jgi:hypothetical protein
MKKGKNENVTFERLFEIKKAFIKKFFMNITKWPLKDT